MRPDVKKDKEWADTYHAKVSDILKENAMHIVSIEPAPVALDTREATDLIIQVDQGTIAVRIRRPSNFRHLTIRSWRSNGTLTELDKIRHGYARWYLYCWTNTAKEIEDWIFVDLNKLRLSGLLENRKTQMNPDGRTGFIYISIPELKLSNCLVSYNRSYDSSEENDTL